MKTYMDHKFFIKEGLQEYFQKQMVKKDEENFYREQREKIGDLYNKYLVNKE